jgi:hypothetical protein
MSIPEKNRDIQKCIVLVILLLLFRSPVFSEPNTQFENLNLKIALFGPGTPLYSWWGHISITIDDTTSDNDRIVDYGIFSFEKENFFTNFALGRLVYSCGSSQAETVINDYITQNRNVTIYTLNVSPEKKREIIERIENDLLPENRDYIYHHFRDNCATRIRDIINTITNDQFYNRAIGKTSHLTLREHIRRYIWFSPFLDWFLNFLLGRGTDNPTTKWDAMFLPSEVALSIQDFGYTSSGGDTIKLVSDINTLHTAIGRPPIPDTPPWRLPLALLAGILAAGVLVFCMALDIRQIKPGKTVWLLLQGFLGCFLGLAGSLLYFMSFFTNHDYTYNNLNTLIANPLLLAALPLGIMSLTTDNYIKQAIAIRIVRIIWTVIFLGGIASAIITIFPQYYQQNQTTLALILPFAFTLSIFPGLLIQLYWHFFWRFLP